MKIIRSFEELDQRQRKVALWSTPPCGIILSILFYLGSGFSISETLWQIGIVVLGGVVAGLLIRFLRKFAHEGHGIRAGKKSG